MFILLSWLLLANTVTAYLLQQIQQPSVCPPQPSPSALDCNVLSLRVTVMLRAAEFNKKRGRSGKTVRQ
jgi:hypothetical protein